MSLSCFFVILMRACSPTSLNISKLCELHVPGGKAGHRPVLLFSSFSSEHADFEIFPGKFREGADSEPQRAVPPKAPGKFLEEGLALPRVAFQGSMQGPILGAILSPLSGAPFVPPFWGPLSEGFGEPPVYGTIVHNLESFCTNKKKFIFRANRLPPVYNETTERME